MKLSILILLITSCFPCFGQNWHLHGVNKNSTYPFEYWFQFEHLDDTSSYQLVKKKDVQYSSLKLRDNSGDTLTFEHIHLTNLQTEYEMDFYSDDEGNSNFLLKNGTYRLELKLGKYDPFELEFEIENDQQVELIIKLGLAPELNVYQIDAKTKLKESKLLEIIECVRENQREFDLCARANNYYVMLHI